MLLSRLNSLLPGLSLLLLCTAVLLCSATTHSATIAFGSYSREDYAAEQAQRASEILDIETRLVRTTVDGMEYTRLLGPQGLSEAEARGLLDRATTSGYPSAWYLPESSPIVAANPSPERPEADESGSTVEIPATSAAPSAPTAPETHVYQDPVPPGTASGTPPERLLLTASGLDEGVSIVVPFLKESEIEFVLDGELNERVWSEVPGYDEMRILEPDTLEIPRHATIMRYFYTEKALYVSMFAEQPPETLIKRLSSRDDYFLRDMMSVTLDTSGAGIYGYWFSLNLGDTLGDGKVAPERQYSREWDGPWDGRTAKTGMGWTAEMVLPWSMMAMPETAGERKIGLYASRLVGYLDERYGFPALPSTGARFMSALQPMEFDEVRPQRQLDFYPYVSGTHDVAADESEGKVGLDMFWRPSTNLQMSATVNPDFGAVESDDVVVNLTSIETYFPEKRLFFLEGNEIFTTTPRSRPQVQGSRTTGSRRTSQLFIPEPTQVVNTRRIGGAPDVDAPPGVIVPGFEQSQPTELLGALKGTGQFGGLRYGAMAAVEDDMVLSGFETNGEEVPVDTFGRDFGVGRLLYENVGQSRQSIGYIGTFVRNQSYDAIVHGVDGHYLDRSGKLQLDLQLLASEVDNVKGYGGLMDVRYTQRRGLVHTLRLDAQDDTLDINDLGFLRRNDNYGGGYTLSFTKSRGLERLRLFNTNFMASYWENGDGLTTRVGTFWRNTFTFPNFFELRTELDYFPARWDDLESQGNGAYRIDERWVADVAFGTDATRVLSFSGRVGVRGEDLGGMLVRSALGLTYKPNHRFSLDLDLNYQDRDGWLLHTAGRQFTTYAAQDFQPRLSLDLFLTARQQFRMSLQWAAINAEEQERWFLPESGDGYLEEVPRLPEQNPRDFVINRMTVQARYRWQIAPLSDLFLVYTRGSNYPSDPEDEIGDMFLDAISNPVVDFFVVKLRYRFGL
jgi:hypothetical protein